MKHGFLRGVTDAGKPRAAKGGFPYPGHMSLGEQRERAERKAAKISASAARRRLATARSFGMGVE